MALRDSNKKWNLEKLASAMGDTYDLSELPTVVYKDGKPVVYDGNRRIILALLHLDLVERGEYSFDTPEVPDVMPCNVCDEETALNNVYRKHADSGSWNILERDAFVHYNMGKPKSTFLFIDEVVDGFISSNPELNKRFVKEEVLDDNTLLSMGIKVCDGALSSQHTIDEVHSILTDILSCIKNKTISTRNHRGRVLEAISEETRNIIEKNKKNDYKRIEFKKQSESKAPSQDRLPHRTRRVNGVKLEYFGGKLNLQAGEVNNMYRDIECLCQFYCKNKRLLSDGFPSVLRMGFRLLCETASRDQGAVGNKILDVYIDKYFVDAKRELSQDEKTFLSAQNVNQCSIIQLLHTGAHNYTSAKAPDQGMAVSIILGKMLKLSHGK